jgi:tetratricopeptide (TPR) repeat protein
MNSFILIYFTLFALGIYLIAGAMVYSNSLHSPFMIDDHGFFDEKMRNPKYLYIQFIPDKEAALGIEDQKSDSYYRPLAHIIPMLCYLTFKDNYVGYHAFNLLLFCGAAFFIFLFLEMLFKERWIAFWAGFFYLVHPINGVVVNYITASVFPAQVIFMLASLWCVIKIATSPSAPRNDMVLRATAILFFALAIMCHETAMALPFYLVLLLVCARGQTWLQAFKQSLPLWIFLVIYFIFRQHYASLNDSILSKYTYYHMSAFQYLASIAQLIVWYLSKLFYPVGIVLIKAIPVVREGVFGWCLVLLALMAAAAWLIFHYRRQPLALMGLTWFVFGFSPFFLAALFQPIHGLMIEPHWFIFPVMGFFIFLASVILSVAKDLNKINSLRDSSAAPQNDKEGSYFISIFLSLFLLIPWTGSALAQNYLWSDEIRYCQYWLKESPGFSAVTFYMAKAYELNKQYVPARHYYMEALKKHYKDWIIYTNLGLIDEIEGKWGMAKQHLEAAIRYDHRFAITLSNLGVIAFQEGDFKKAKEYFSKAIEADRFKVLPRLDLGSTCSKMGDVQGAIDAYEGVLSIDPSQDIALSELAQIYVARKDRVNALRVCRALVKYSTRALYVKNAAILLKYYGYPDEARQAMEKVNSLGNTE